jgi:hypothetical protein
MTLVVACVSKKNLAGYFILWVKFYPKKGRVYGKNG